MTHAPNNLVAPATRRGLSHLELLGCVVAVAGGVWIGSSYLGVDLHGAAYQALDETELLTKIPEDWRPPNPECPDGDCPNPADARAAEIVRLRSELEELRFEVALLNGGASEIVADQTAPLSPEDEAVRDRSQQYWQALSQIVYEVTAIQTGVVAYTGTDQRSRALAVRRRAFDYGKEAVDLLDTTGVDQDAVATGVRVSEWFGQGSAKLTTALELKTSQPVGGRSISGADLWAQTEAELEKRTDLVRRRSLETSAYLTTKYFVEFPPLGL